MYSNGESENIIRAFIQKVRILPLPPRFVEITKKSTLQYNIPRDNLVIMTKTYFIVPQDPAVSSGRFHGSLINTRDYVNHGGLSRTALLNQVEASLRRLGTSYIDVLQIHCFDPTTPVEETMKALHDLLQSGKVRYLGACNLRTWQLAEMNRVAEVNGWTQFVSSQVEYSLLYRNEVLLSPLLL